MFDPEDEGIKRATGSFWVQVAREVDERLQRLADRTDTIAQAGYNVQVPIEAGRPAIFVLEEGARRKVVLEGRAIRARSDMILSRDELIRIAKEEPERLSAGVTLRPLLQSWILPASAYVAGPHEMAYWAQMTEAFEPLGLPRPCVIPRASFTLLEGKIRRRLNKLGVEAERFFGDMDALYDELLEEHGDDDGDTVLEQVRDQVMETRSALEALTERPEFGGLENAVDAAYRKIGYQLEKLEGNFRDRLKRQHGDLLKHWEKLRVHLRPEGQPQERVISPHYYLTLYGERLLDTLLESCGDAIGRHGLLDLQEDHG
jgi:bacillithiol biosynthesis cysteine-adding enzyme BshC